MGIVLLKMCRKQQVLPKIDTKKKLQKWTDLWTGWVNIAFSNKTWFDLDQIKSAGDWNKKQNKKKQL